MRLREYDYSNSGYYFITIVTGKRIPLFGAVLSGEMVVTHAGFIACEEIKKTHYLRVNAFIDEFMIMPDHVHFILLISESKDCVLNSGCVARPGCNLVARYEATSRETEYFSSISPRPKTVSAIVRSFKSAVTKRCHQAGTDDFSWQRGFYDRIIRDQYELNATRRYIRQNPEKWWQRNMNPS